MGRSNEEGATMKFKCTKCGGNLIEEGDSGVYFCDNCCGMTFSDAYNFTEIEKRRIK